MTTNNIYKQFEEEALQWVQEAGKILISQEHSFTIATQKDVIDVATSADVAVNTFLTNKIREKYPDHGIYSEESDGINIDAQYCWIIDPLDCTKEYVKGIGEYNLLVAVEENKQVVVGIVRRFGHDVVYSTSYGNGAYLADTKLHVSSVSSLDHAFLGINLPNKIKTTPNNIDNYMRLFSTLIKNVYRLRPGSDDAKMFAWVAQGAYDVCISLPNSNKWFDVAPALLLVEEAGGKVTDWEGNTLKNHDLSKGIIVSNGVLHERLLDIVKEVI